MKTRVVWLGLVLLVAAAAHAQEIEIQAQLMGALGSQTSHKQLSTLTAKPAPAPAAPQSAAQPDLTVVKADFVPGEKVIFYDDFTDMAGDEPPPHWKVRGGSVALKVGAGIRQLTVMEGDVMLTPNLQGLPKNFTLETEMKFDDPSDIRAVWYLHDKTWSGISGPDAALRLWLQTAGEAGLNVAVNLGGPNGSEELASTQVKADFNQPVKEAVWIQNGRLRVYVNGERVVDVNQVELPQLTGADLFSEYSEGKLGYRMVRIAESTPDFSQVITSTGRYVTHGIYFDTDSDTLKPESAPLIKTIAQGLEKNPTLKLKIEGHTDSTGSAEHNLDLSKRRAEAVKAVLVSQFKVDASRLTTDGLGSTKPIDSNDTPQGRAQNRRVEFVKQ
jgi:OOP family OmpA-OmpF porin